ncbi:MAG TPA: TonB-dependent receptor [Acidobacteriaceae bacterium]|nr:TonB-dependent receptor [Acidobacteriaceae bacterium]
MHTDLPRALRPDGASLPLRAHSLRRFAFTLFLLLLFATAADAVVVRGRVTTALGTPVAGARVQLVQNGKTIAQGTAAVDGSFEIRTADAGRFTLLASAGGFLPAIGVDFYGGAEDIVTQDAVLATTTVRQEVSVTATGIPTPLPQLTAPVSVIPLEDLVPRIGVGEEMRQTPSAVLVQTGMTGGVMSLFVRGGNSTANLVLVDGIPADDVGGVFDFGTVSSTAIGHVEMYRGPNSALYGTDAGAAVITLNTPRGTTLQPVLNYSGDAGTLHEYRNEVTLGGVDRKLDYFGAFSRFDTSNALPRDKYHSATSAANIGYEFTGNTQMRFTIRDGVSATGLPSAHDFYGVSSDAKQSDQDLYSGITLENRTKADWHNLLRYGIARKREQEKMFTNQGTPVEVFPGFFEYFGNVSTIRGANGYTATGQASFFLPNDDQASNRDQLYYQSDYTFSPKFLALFGFRYDNERGVFNDNDFGENEKVQRTNFEYNLQFQGQAWGRLFYSAGGAVEKNHLYGIAGTPRIGLAYVPVRPSDKLFHGTKIRANAATGVQEPSLSLEFNSLYRQISAADRAAFHVGPPQQQRSRNYDIGVEQNVMGERLVLKADYFHNVFDRQLEGVSGEALAQYFNLNFPSIFSAYLNSLAYRASGAELEVEWKFKHRLFVHGGYTYLDTSVVQSFANDAVLANQGTPTENPNLPGIAIGAESPLVGGRPFRRPPHTGFFGVDYNRPRFSVAFKGALASRSDDSTFLDFEDINGGNSMILPNRDLDFGYAKLDLGGTFRFTSKIGAFVQLENLLNDQHIGPIGFPGLPLTARAGFKIRLGGD